MQNVKNTGRSSSIGAGLLMGLLAGLVTTMVTIGALTVMIQRGSISWEAIGYGIMFTVFVSAFLGAKVSTGRIRHQKLFVCLLSGVLYIGSLLLLTALLFGARYEAVGVTVLLAIGGCGCAAIGEGRGKKLRRYRN